MIWFIIYITGSFLATWLLARRIGKNHDPNVTEESGYVVAYPMAFFGSWIVVLLILFYYDRQNNRENNKNTEGKGI